MVLSAPCSNQTPGVLAASDAPSRPKPHDMTLLSTSGYLERLGFDYRPATPEILFREPSKAGAALARNR